MNPVYFLFVSVCVVLIAVLVLLWKDRMKEDLKSNQVPNTKLDDRNYYRYNCTLVGSDGNQISIANPMSVSAASEQIDASIGNICKNIQEDEAEQARQYALNPNVRMVGLSEQARSLPDALKEARTILEKLSKNGKETSKDLKKAFKSKYKKSTKKKTIKKKKKK